MVLCAVMAALAGKAPAQDSLSSDPTNLRVYEALAARLADSMACSNVAADSPAVDITVSPVDLRWFLLDPVVRSFRTQHWIISVNDSSRFSAEFGALDMKVRYSNLRRTGFLGSRVLDRTVMLLARMRLVDRRAGRLIMAADRSAQYSDVVGLSQIELLEQASIPVTHATIPPEDFFSGFGEPLIIIGAIAAAIYLLFTVRS